MASQDLSVRVDKPRNDEIGSLVDRFNEMLASMQQRELLLEDYRRDLERMVETRTAQLNGKRERYRIRLESTHAVPWKADLRAFTVSWIAPQITGLAGYDPDSILGKSGRGMVHPLDRERLKRDV
jgi:HAMP domain-containing protein